MKLLDALPAKKKKEILSWLTISGVLLSLLLIIFFIVVILQTKKLFALKREYFRLGYELGDFEARQKEKKSLEGKNKDLEKKFNRLQNYSANGAKLGLAFLEGVSQAMPAKIFLDEFNFGYKKKDLNLIGFCPDIFLLTEFMDKLAEKGFSEHIKLEKLTSSELKEYPLRFSISVQLKEF